MSQGSSVTVDALPDWRASGKVARITPMATATARTSMTRGAAPSAGSTKRSSGGRQGMNSKRQ